MKKMFIYLTFFMLCFLCACSGNQPGNKKDGESFSIMQSSKPAYQKISGKEAKAMMEDGASYILLDVRTDEEFKEKRIDGAILIADYEIVNRAETELPDKNARILIYCRSGRRSANVANEMIQMGYTNVYDFGGIIDWQYGTVSGDERRSQE